MSEQLTPVPLERQGRRCLCGKRFLALTVLLAACATEPPPETPDPASRPPATSPVFTDVTGQAGIDWRHTSGRAGRKYVVETMGSGAAAIDADRDGYVDLYVVDSGPLPGYEGPPALGNALLRNRGPRAGWTFEEITDRVGVGDDGYGMGVTVGDTDNDGDSEIFVTNAGPNRLFRNDLSRGGELRFADVTAASDIGADSSWSTGAAFGDVDNDGDLDLYVANYLDYAFPPSDSLLSRPRRHIAPTEYPGQRDFLYRNDGAGGFEDITEAAGLLNLEGRQLGVLFVDLDNDGDVDLFQGNDATPNTLFRNDGSGRFREVGLLAGVAFNGAGQPEGTMGVDAADVTGDGWQDLVMTNFQWESNTLYRAVGDGSFVDVSHESGLGGPSFARLAFGINLFDADNDGDQDLYVGNGHIDEDIGLFDPQAAYGQPDQLFLNDGQGGFLDASPGAGPAFADSLVARGSVVFDYDNDGDSDLFVVNSAGPARLLRNDTPGSGHWLRLHLEGRASNRDAFGARVRAVCDDLIVTQEHRSGVSYLSQDDPRLHLGLGDCDRVEELSIRFPSGHQVRLHGLDVDRELEIVEPDGVAAVTTESAVDPLDVADVADDAGTLGDQPPPWEMAPMVLPPEVRRVREVPDLTAARRRWQSSDRGAEARLDWAEALRLNRHADAEPALRRAAEEPSTRARALVGLGQMALSANDPRGALEFYEQAIQADPRLADPHYYMANAFVRLGQYERAVSAYESALDRDPRHLRAWVNLASTHARQTDYGPAIASLERGLTQLSDSDELRLQLARILHVQTRFDDAGQHLLRLAEAEEASPDVFELLARIEIDRHRADRAIAWLRQGLAKHPDDARLRTRLGVALVGQDSLAAARDHLERAVRLDADAEEANYQLGRLYLRLGLEERGAAALDRFRLLQAQHDDLLEAKTAIVLNPEDGHAYYRLGAVYSRIGRWEAARQAYEIALRIDPAHLDARNNLGNIHLRRRQLAEAARVYRQLLAVDSTYVRAHHNLGNVHLLSGDRARALAAFRRALRHDPAYAPAREALVRLGASQGESP